MATEEASLYLKFITQGVQQGTQQIRQMGTALSQTSLAGKAFDSMQKQIRGTAQEAEALNGLLKSGNYEVLARAGARNDARLAQMQRLAKSADVIVQKERVLSGAYEKEVRETMALSKEQEGLAAARRKVELTITQGKLGASLTLLQEKLQGVGKAGTIGFGFITAGIGGWVRAGMAGTAEAQRLGMAMQLISREVANVFAPWIHKAVTFVEELGRKFRTLTASQQETIREWVKWGAIISGTMMILPRVVGGVNALVQATRALGLARAGAAVTGLVRGGAAAGAAGQAAGVAGAAGTAGLLGPIGLTIGAFVGLLAVTKEGRETLKNLWKAVEPIVTALGRLATSIAHVLLPVIEGLSKAIAWLVNQIPGLSGGGKGESSGGMGLAGAGAIGGALAGFKLGGPFGAAIGGTVGYGIGGLARFGVGLS